MSNKQYNFYINSGNDNSQNAHTADATFTTIPFPFFDTEEQLVLTVSEVFYYRDGGDQTLDLALQLSIEESDLYETGIPNTDPRYITVRTLKNDYSTGQRTFDLVKYLLKLNRPSITFKIRLVNLATGLVESTIGDSKYGISMHIRRLPIERIID